MIVSDHWLDECGKAGYFLPAKSYLVKDKAAEKQHSFSLIRCGLCMFVVHVHVRPGMSRHVHVRPGMYYVHPGMCIQVCSSSHVHVRSGIKQKLVQWTQTTALLTYNSCVFT